VGVGSPFQLGALFVFLGGLLSLKIPVSRRATTPAPPTPDEVAPGVTGA
jgi:hypothetical protein